MEATGIEPRHLREFHGYIEATRRWARAEPALAAQADVRQLLAAYPGEDASDAGGPQDPAIADAMRRLDAALNGGNIATWVWELDTDHLHVDRNMGAFFNVSDPASGVPREVYGCAIHPDDRRMVNELLERAIRTGEDYVAEYRIITFDPPRWAYARARVVHDDAGRAVRLAGVVMDITDRKNAEAALRQSEIHFRNLADTMPQMVWITHPDGRHEYFNRRWYEFTGVPDGSTGGEGWAGLFHPEDDQRVRAHWRQNLQSGEPYEIEYRLRNRAGRYCWFLCRAMPVRDASGQIVRWFGTCTDIDSFKRLQSRLRRSEDRFRKVFEHAAIGIAIADGPGRFEQCNPAYCTLLGYTGEELRQMSLKELVHPEDLAANLELNRRLRAGEIPFYELENRYLRKDGEVVWVRKFVSPLDGANAVRGRLIALVTDTTERRRNENALKEAKEAAEAANRGKDRFLAMLSHELRTPLTPVLMTAAELRGDERLPADVREHLDMIERNVALEARLIDDLLDLTRITRGKLALRAEPCDLQTLLALVAEMVQGDAHIKQIHVELDIASRQTRIVGDPARLQQVFWNLLRNAVKFTPTGGRVRVHASDAGERARIEVSDNGIGFEPAAAGRIFEPFEQCGSGH
jgi:PAS domain S-box-containing protein